VQNHQQQCGQQTQGEQLTLFDEACHDEKQQRNQRKMAKGFANALGQSR
jgi:hypothetical protein